MALITTIFVYILNIINLFLKKNKGIIANVMILLLWILFFGNYNNPDYGVYYTSYSTQKVINDLGYLKLTEFFYNIGWSYEQFLMLFSLIGFLLIKSTIKKYTKNYSYIYLLYFLFPFMFDIVQIRNFMAMSIFIYSIRYLVSDVKLSKLKYICLILIASTIQKLAIMYLLFLFVDKIVSNKIIKKIFTFIVICSLLISLNSTILNTVGSLLSNIFSDIRFDNYFSVQTRFGYLYYWALQIISFVLVKKSYNRIEKQKNKINIESYKFTLVMYSVIQMTFLFFPFYVFQSNFFRLFRNIYILIYMIFSITSDIMPSRSIEKIFYNIIIISFVMGISFLELFSHYFSEIVINVFKYNFLLK